MQSRQHGQLLVQRLCLPCGVANHAYVQVLQLLQRLDLLDCACGCGPNTVPPAASKHCNAVRCVSTSHHSCHAPLTAARSAL